MNGERGYGGYKMGKGFGSGRCRGKGRRRGIGQRRADGRGPRNGQGFPQSNYSPTPSKPHDRTKESHEEKSLARTMENHLRALRDRIFEIEQPNTELSAASPTVAKKTSKQGWRTNKMTATLDKEKCFCCGLCIGVCGERAITMNDVVMIDSEKCTACGACIDECPNEAIALSKMKEFAVS